MVSFLADVKISDFGQKPWTIIRRFCRNRGDFLRSFYSTVEGAMRLKFANGANFSFIAHSCEELWAWTPTECTGVVKVVTPGPGTYVLYSVFCCFQWLQVLDLIAKALNENGIKYHLLNQKKTFQV